MSLRANATSAEPKASKRNAKCVAIGGKKARLAVANDYKVPCTKILKAKFGKETKGAFGPPQIAPRITAYYESDERGDPALILVPKLSPVQKFIESLKRHIAKLKALFWHALCNR